MPAQGLSWKIAPESEQSTRILSALQQRFKMSAQDMERQHAKWRKAEEAFLAYVPESETERTVGKQTYRTIMLPYSYAVLMASHTYWASVFLARNPVFQFMGRHGETQQQVQAIEALIDYQVTVGRMLVPLYCWLLDVGKYGVGIIGCYWDREVAVVSEIQEVEETLWGMLPTGKRVKRRSVREVTGYAGNRIYNVRPYDWFPDTRVPLMQFQRGEFCGVLIMASWNEVHRRAVEGEFFNVELLKGRGKGSRRVEPGGRTILPASGSGISCDHVGETEVYELIEMTVELSPREWGLGDTDRYEKWVFTCTSDFGLLIGARPLGALHNSYQMQILMLEPEAHVLFNRSIFEILAPVQQTVDWLVNSHFYNVRKTLNNQFIYDPSMVVVSDILNPVAGGGIRLSENAYGTPVSNVIQQLMVHDVTRGHFSDLQQMIEMGQRIWGVSDPLMGMLEARGRRTAQEVRTSASFGINRLKVLSEFFSAQGWSALAQMLVQHTQQYYDLEEVFRIAGGLEGATTIKVTPEDIQGFYDFVPVDGTLPVDRYAMAKMQAELFAQIRQDPVLAPRYDLPRMFSWIAQTAGMKNIRQFEVQVAPDEELNRAAEAGNVVPIASRVPPTQFPNAIATEAAL